jgi:hypothetical protein
MNNSSRHILAAALFLSAALLLAAWQIAPAILMAGKSYSNPSEAFISYRSEIGSAPLVPAWLAILAALGILLWPFLVQRMKPQKNDDQRADT